MWTQTKARELHLRSIDEDLLLLGVAAESDPQTKDMLAQCKITSAFISEYLAKLPPHAVLPAGAAISFTSAAKSVLFAAAELASELQSDKLLPEHILYALLDAKAKLARSLLESKGADVEALKSYLGRQLRIDEFVLGSVRPITRPERPAKTLDEWFTQESIQAVTRAQDSASAEGKKAVCIDHLLAALIDMNAWVPAEVAPKLRALLDYARGEGDTAQAAAEFSPRVVKAFMEAKSETSRRAAECVAPEHLLLGAVKVLAAPDATSESEGLYGTLKTAYVNHVNELARNKARPEPEPLEIDDHTVRATVRFVNTVKRALNHAKSVGELNIGVPQLVLALINEASISEVPFISNRTDSLTQAQIEIKKLIDNRHTEGDVITSIVQSAAEHAKRLCSKRLDINHLALALLDDAIQDESVAVVIRGLGDGSSRLAARKRLEQCLLWQSGKETYQAEPGVTVDLQKIHLLLSDG
jgi:ATP-dependent Clp protease ATP-binding subunit ClpA